MSAVILRGDARHLPLPDESVDLICTSPPFWGLRDYRDDGKSMAGQIGAEATPQEYVASLLECTQEWVRVLKPTGSIFINLGDSYYSGKGSPGRTTTDPKNAGRDARRTVRSPLDYGQDLPRKTLIGLPWRYAIRCVDDLGLILRRDIIWSKVNGLPESVTDRCRSSHEYLFHFVKQPRYYSAVDEIREPHQSQSIARTQRNRFAPDLTQAGVGSPNTLNPADACNPLGKLPGSVWEIASQPFVPPPDLAVQHYAAFPFEIPRRIILGWSPPGICTECGEGQRPVVSKPGLLGGDNNPESRSGTRRFSTMDGGQKNWERRIAEPDRITGYACACSRSDAPTRPATVLDPFSGTGTTALVADVLGRTGIGVDLSHDYARLARWRTTDPGERARALQVPKPPPVPDGQTSLFDGLEVAG